jgi:single-strand DNA-binding protein
MRFCFAGEFRAFPARKNYLVGTMWLFRIVVPRKTRDGVDTLDIAAWTSKTRRTGLTLKSEEWVEISGAIRRRFWQAPGGLASRWQIEASTISRI